ncbi:glycosyltransferase family 39 protein [Patescibacteria group bacterium]|nr:glycosyltransferase family 39 protein [Patescibacteria group bacterium]
MKLVKWDFWFLAIIFLVNIALKTFRLGSPAQAYFDEHAYYIPAAREYLSGNFIANFEHPPLTKLFMSAGVSILGDNFWGWRIPEVLVGSLGVIFIYLLAKEMFGGRFIPTLAAIFLTVEFSWFVNSRLANIEIYLATFSLAAAYFFWKFFKSESIKALILTGVFIGLAIATKWSGLLILAFLMAFYIWNKRLDLLQTLRKAALIIVIAFMVYVASYGFYLNSHSFADLFGLHQRMINYHLNYVPESTSRSNPDANLLNNGYAPWAWIFNPSYLYAGDEGGETSKTVLFLYNPAIFWGILGTLIFTFKKIIKDERKTFLLGAFLCFWLPWFLAPRFTLPYYLLASIPFGIILLSKFISENYNKRGYLLVGFIASSIALFLFYYPLLSYISIPTWYLRLLTGAVGIE